MEEKKQKALAKYLVYVLRHNPNEIGLELGLDGYVEIKDVLKGLEGQKKYSDCTEKDLREIVQSQTEKHRLEIKDKLIRCCYGHTASVIDKINYTPAEPPSLLYHGTPIKNLDSIREGGLQPGSRKYVHLTTSKKLAQMVGQRRSPDVVVIEILCEKAREKGILFYNPEPQIWLTNALSPEFLEIPRSGDLPSKFQGRKK